MGELTGRKSRSARGGSWWYKYTAGYTAFLLLLPRLPPLRYTAVAAAATLETIMPPMTQNRCRRRRCRCSRPFLLQNRGIARICSRAKVKLDLTSYLESFPRKFEEFHSRNLVETAPEALCKFRAARLPSLPRCFRRRSDPRIAEPGFDARAAVVRSRFRSTAVYCPSNARLTSLYYDVSLSLSLSASASIVFST